MASTPSTSNLPINFEEDDDKYFPDPDPNMHPVLPDLPDGYTRIGVNDPYGNCGPGFVKYRGADNKTHYACCICNPRFPFHWIDRPDKHCPCLDHIIIVTKSGHKITTLPYYECPVELCIAYPFGRREVCLDHCKNTHPKALKKLVLAHNSNLARNPSQREWSGAITELCRKQLRPEVAWYYEPGQKKVRELKAFLKGKFREPAADLDADAAGNVHQSDAETIHSPTSNLPQPSGSRRNQKSGRTTSSTQTARSRRKRVGSALRGAPQHPAPQSGSSLDSLPQTPTQLFDAAPVRRHPSMPLRLPAPFGFGMDASAVSSTATHLSPRIGKRRLAPAGPIVLPTLLDLSELATIPSASEDEVRRPRKRAERSRNMPPPTNPPLAPPPTPIALPLPLNLTVPTSGPYYEVQRPRKRRRQSTPIKAPPASMPPVPAYPVSEDPFEQAIQDLQMITKVLHEGPVRDMSSPSIFPAAEALTEGPALAREMVFEAGFGEMHTDLAAFPGIVSSYPVSSLVTAGSGSMITSNFPFATSSIAGPSTAASGFPISSLALPVLPLSANSKTPSMILAYPSVAASPARHPTQTSATPAVAGENRSEVPSSSSSRTESHNRSTAPLSCAKHDSSEKHNTTSQRANNVTLASITNKVTPAELDPYYVYNPEHHDDDEDAYFQRMLDSWHGF